MALAQGSDSSKAAADSRLWPVGDSAGWSFGVLGWPNYKPFKAGDVLCKFFFFFYRSFSLTSLMLGCSILPSECSVQLQARRAQCCASEHGGAVQHVRGAP